MSKVLFKHLVTDQTREYAEQHFAWTRGLTLALANRPYLADLLTPGQMRVLRFELDACELRYCAKSNPRETLQRVSNLHATTQLSGGYHVYDHDHNGMAAGFERSYYKHLSSLLLWGFEKTLPKIVYDKRSEHEACLYINQTLDVCYTALHSGYAGEEREAALAFLEVFGGG